ncbi:ABC transporter ATP-binding protein [Tepidimonas sp.]|uniref:ABC transporter ATP-binding protein n=1 Tax=Tepidimonas sp. TaxID=2002775 RepID=UPI002FE10C15
MVVLEAVRFRWPRRPQACLDLTHLALAQGERVMLRGPSGSGKSTLLNLLSGVVTPEHGHIEVLGTRIEALSARARDRFRADHIGIIFQQFNLLPWLPVLDNVCLPCVFSARRRERAGDVQAQARRLLTQLGIAAASWARPARELSVGQQQRVAAARALMGHPDLILADEPTSALDAELQHILVDELCRACGNRGASLLFVSHDARLTERFDRVVELADINRSAAGERT